MALALRASPMAGLAFWVSRIREPVKKDRRCWTDFSAVEDFPRNGSRFDLCILLCLCVCVCVFCWFFFCCDFLFCSKSLIKLTKTRIDVIRRKRNATQKFLRKDVADLLSNGLDINAYGRVFFFIFVFLLNFNYILSFRFADFADLWVWWISIRILVFWLVFGFRESSLNERIERNCFAYRELSFLFSRKRLNNRETEMYLKAKTRVLFCCGDSGGGTSAGGDPLVLLRFRWGMLRLGVEASFCHAKTEVRIVVTALFISSFVSFIARYDVRVFLLWVACSFVFIGYCIFDMSNVHSVLWS